ncbi:DNA-binding transcriptional response regulator, NtrC family, contains REC, AAA-type ATPase, and a Fis-type DNA-binding domains [Chitinophaga costaii]|uniref:DNA-binding transcriptional response regulator, NtrC family, contains REC, AAA-type ATPase, and a Fis-type DNA-binding domains n=1 Tax=Chitinophaga costaii TaxID=1335309 RepID=A0A1C3YP74_9BACT|nr:sigma-54 dependent transcriptional regulator [Chitinophaga costaii]PUZ30034.1 sigma-54-dependent Fis family transcriptional regulator [Chitinophaga costaii]SCB71880.1 DNA-binding transcriptional response regulator, NtrC family, contains REC, AAA-type ATPase, and a Fis-type DNA-binding domains [Chitinophaga costaii]
MILIIDDDIAVRTSLLLLLQNEKLPATAAATPAEALYILAAQPISLVILDLNFTIATSGREGMQLLRDIKQVNSAVPVILITGWGTIALAVEGMKLGASDFINKPWINDHLLQSVKTLLHLQENQPRHSTRQQLDQQYQLSHIIGQDPRLLDILETIGRIAPTDAPVLITGESGTGKELIAEAIHQNSLRQHKPFVKVNLGGISTSLFESEMFGHVRGAFTDARTDRMGRFEMANKGTIFLDEIGELDTSSQVKLLRVLQDRTYEVLGSSRTRTADIRVVCATNRKLEDMVQQGNFREDLFYRINLITIHLPALRERPGDIPLLVNFFIQNLQTIYHRPQLGVTPAALKWMAQLPLPGNIRQLKNLIERSVLMSRKDLLDTSDFSAQLALSAVKKGQLQLPEVGTITLDELEAMMIRKALAFHHHKIAKAAAALGITRSSLYRRLEKYHIPYDETQD